MADFDSNLPGTGKLQQIFRCKYCAMNFRKGEELIEHKKKNHIAEMIAARKRGSGITNVTSRNSNSGVGITTTANARNGIQQRPATTL